MTCCPIAKTQRIEIQQHHTTLSLHYDKWNVLGHSYGGMVAQGYALKYSVHVSHLILANTFHSFVMWQEIFSLKKAKSYDREEVVRTFVSIFLKGITKD